jgi:hypothetical protein
MEFPVTRRLVITTRLMRSFPLHIIGFPQSGLVFWVTPIFNGKTQNNLM